MECLVCYDQLSDKYHFCKRCVALYTRKIGNYPLIIKEKDINRIYKKIIKIK